MATKAKVPSQAGPVRTASRSRRAGSALILTALLVVGGLGLWRWQQQTRPGVVQERQGAAALAAGQSALAERDWLEGVRSDPTYLGNYLRLGDLCAQTQQLPWAAHFYGMAAQLAPDNGTALMKLAQTDQQMGQTLAALGPARRAFALLPHDARAAALLGSIASDLNDRTDALPSLLRAHALDPDNGAVTVQLAEAEMDTGKASQAETLLAPYVQTHPADGEANFTMATLEQQKPPTPQTLAAATAYARQAFTDAPQNVAVASLLGKLYLSDNQPAKALSVFQTAHALRPGAVSPLQGLVACEMRLGRTQQAARQQPALQAAFQRRDQLTHLDYQLRLDPGNVALRRQRDQLEQEIGE